MRPARQHAAPQLQGRDLEGLQRASCSSSSRGYRSDGNSCLRPCFVNQSIRNQFRKTLDKEAEQSCKTYTGTG